MTIIAALPFPACVRQLYSSGAVLTKSNYGGLYPAHIRTTSIQKAMLAVGSGVAALSDPYRHGKWRAFQECSGLHQIVLQVFRYQPETVGQKRFSMKILVTWWENARGAFEFAWSRSSQVTGKRNNLFIASHCKGKNFCEGVLSHVPVSTSSHCPTFAFMLYDHCNLTNSLSL